MNINYNELSINVIISVLFISLFIGAFFFTYGVYIEGLIVKKQMKFLSEDIAGYLNLLGSTVNKGIKDKLLEVPVIDIHDENDEIKESNSKVLKTALNATIAFVILTIIIVNYLNKSVNLNITDVIIKNLIILFFIAITEYLFLTYFAADYISIDPNKVKYNVVENLKKLI
jgi:hypothetical protein